MKYEVRYSPTELRWELRSCSHRETNNTDVYYFNDLDLAMEKCDRLNNELDEEQKEYEEFYLLDSANSEKILHNKMKDVRNIISALGMRSFGELA